MQCTPWRVRALYSSGHRKATRKDAILTLFSENTLSGDKTGKRDHAVLKAFAISSKENKEVKWSRLHGGPEPVLT